MHLSVRSPNLSSTNRHVSQVHLPTIGDRYVDNRMPGLGIALGHPLPFVGTCRKISEPWGVSAYKTRQFFGLCKCSGINRKRAAIHRCGQLAGITEVCGRSGGRYW